jgi:hypothetical protein
MELYLVSTKAGGKQLTLLEGKVMRKGNVLDYVLKGILLFCLFLVLGGLDSCQPDDGDDVTTTTTSIAETGDDDDDDDDVTTTTSIAETSDDDDDDDVTTSSYLCDTEASKIGYELAGQYDDCLTKNAQIMTTHIEEFDDIEMRDTEFDEFGVFESNFAEISAEEKWIKPISIFFDEDMSAYPDAPDTINGAFVTKMIAKDKVEAYFNVTIDEPQGQCVDVQQVVYDNVYNNILTEEQREKYTSDGKSLSILPDSPDAGGLWVGKDPSELITNDGDDYFFEPYSLNIEYTDTSQVELLRGVKYCKLLSHQAILSWMLEKSFEEAPQLLTPYDSCTQPTSTEARGGSCILYFSQPQNYYCSDYVGTYFSEETGFEKCEDRWDTNGGVLDPSYSTLPCSERTEEIEASIPGYVGLTGQCVIHCGEENEFIWNIYVENPEGDCTGFDFFYPEDIE